MQNEYIKAMGKNKKKLFFVVSSNARINDGYTSRVFMEIGYLRDYFDISVLIPEGDKMEVDFGSSINLIEYPTCQKGSKLIKAIRTKQLFQKKYIEEVPHGRNVIVCGESLVPSFLAMMAARKNGNPFIFDCHGTEPDEYRLYHSNSIKKIVVGKSLDLMEQIVIRHADLIVTVTQNQYKKWNINRNHVILPMMPADFFFDKRSYRKTTREVLGIAEDEIVFVYAGRMQRWQMAEETVKAYKNISSKMKNTRLLILSPEIEAFNKLIESSGIKNAIVRSVQYEDMPKYLDASDFGFCLRGNSIINKVASPTKVLEYLVRNVKPVLTPYVGEYAKALTKEKLAVVVNLDELGAMSINADDFIEGQKRSYEYVQKYREDIIENYISAIKTI